MNRRVHPRPFLLVLAFLSASPAQGQKPEQQSNEFFQSGKILKLVLDVGAPELDSLRRDPRKYVKATLREDDKIVYKDVGIHLKGSAGSVRGVDDKPSVTVNSDKYVAGQLFHGMDKFHLTNSVQDPSYLAELISGELFRAAGVPASRIAHCTLTLAGKPRGLFYIKEGYDSLFLKRNFGSNRGNFYDSGFTRDIDQPLQLLRGKDDVKDHADLKALVAAARERDPTMRFQKLEKHLDIDRFISYIAGSVITWDVDGYPLRSNNYRIYHDPKRDKVTFFPTGMDQMFYEPGGALLPPFQGMVAQGLMSTPEGRQLYLARMEEILKQHYDEKGLLKKLDELQARIQPVLASVDAGAGRDYSNQVNRLRKALTERRKALESQLKALKK